MKALIYRRALNVIGFFLLFSCSFSQEISKSVKNNKTDFSLTTRINSTGHFPYSGSLLNHHFNIDFNLYYKKGKSGFFVFKSLDLEDISSYVNYLQTGVFTNLPISKNLTIAPYTGFVFDQTAGFADKTSDAFFSLVTTYKKNNIKIENTSLLLNFFEIGSNKSLLNRMEVNFAGKKTGISFYAWHKTSLFGNNEYVSSAVLVKFPKITLTKSVGLESSIMYHSFLTNYKPSYALRRGILFTFSFPLDFLVN